MTDSGQTSNWDPLSLWKVVSRTPGVGVSILDAEGQLLFVNDTSQLLFFNRHDVAYHGKKLEDFHPAKFCEEQREMIRRVLAEDRPLAINHIYLGRRIYSTIWPIHDSQPPFHRVIVVTHENATDQAHSIPVKQVGEEVVETISTTYIDFGSLNVLTRRELEVLALLGHGLSVPKVAALLHRSPKTIERHKSSIGQKLGLHGQAEIVAVTTAMGLHLADTQLPRYSG